MKHIINSHLHGGPPLLPFNHQLLMREAAKQLKIEQEKKEAERRKVIFFNFIIIIYTLLITIYSIIFAKEDKGSCPKSGLYTVRLIVKVDTPAPLRHPDRKKTVFWTTFLM